MSHTQLLLVLSCVALIAGCDSDVETSAATGAGPSEKAVFVPDGEPSAPSVVLREASITATGLELDVVGYGIDDLYGVSFRLEEDAAALTLSSFVSDYPIARGLEPRAGVAFFVATASGDVPGRAVDGEVIGKVRFTRVPGVASPVRFVESRSDLVDAAGSVRPEVAWIGGELRIE